MFCLNIHVLLDLFSVSDMAWVTVAVVNDFTYVAFVSAVYVFHLSITGSTDLF